MDPAVERELANLREQFKLTMLGYQALADERDKARTEATKLALAANEKRLDTMNEFREALSDQGGRMMTRKESETAIGVVQERVEQNRVSHESRLEVVTTPLADRMEQNRVFMEARIEAITRPKWSLMTALFSICLGLIGGAWVLTGLKFDAAVAPIALLAEQVKVQANGDADRLRKLETTTFGSVQADASSQTDRAQLNTRLRVLETLVGSDEAERRTQYSVMAAKLVEIETQFCAGDIVRNLMNQQDSRLTALMFAKLYPGEKLVTDNAFYPRICNRAQLAPD
jgi:hypothetical protein